MKNLNDLLAGRNASQHFLAQRLLLDPRNEILRDLEIDVRFEKREAHLPERIIDVRLADRPKTAKVLEDVLKLVAELRKHDADAVRERAPRRLLFLFLRLHRGRRSRWRRRWRNGGHWA